ncbi:hypothetical protein LOK49_LG01G04069 [Camellia lanceoleosa]|uniref:Uncharacterized protein n=1 Tax=Camellia lanceoleosa TaxID=1840588 RepID=A0ACC0J172_9ERIC|nr:hypothetical protein LOK49_LG01G04069 [Camellia lanceoleosa]
MSAGTSSNVLLTQASKETLFAALIFQDLSFFDKEAVGDLTSRLGADCQRMSHVIENDMHLILCSSLRGIGALINLLTLSWPLAFSTLVICSVLSTIFLFYGQFQKKAAKFTQEYSASANEVFAVLLGEMSILTGHVSAEQLMKSLMRVSTAESFIRGDFTLMSKKHTKCEEIEDKVVWITGASRGIGEVLAKQLASLGAKLIISARNEAELERVKKQLSGMSFHYEL